MPGWIKIHRQIQNCLIWDDKPFNMASAWIDLLLLANHEDKETIFDKKPILVKRGQRITSVRELSARWGWGKDKTLRFLRLLESEKMIVKDSDSRRTLLTIVNYGIYQDCENENKTVIRTLTGQSQATNKNDKNDKNNNICSNSDDLNETEKQKKNKTKLADEENEELVKNKAVRKIKKNTTSKRMLFIFPLFVLDGFDLLEEPEIKKRSKKRKTKKKEPEETKKN